MCAALCGVCVCLRGSDRFALVLRTAAAAGQMQRCGESRRRHRYSDAQTAHTIPTSHTPLHRTALPTALDATHCESRWMVRRRKLRRQFLGTQGETLRLLLLLRGEKARTRTNQKCVMCDEGTKNRETKRLLDRTSDARAEGAHHRRELLRLSECRCERRALGETGKAASSSTSCSSTSGTAVSGPSISSSSSS